MRPLRDPIRNIVYYADPTDITGVMIGGKMIMKDGEIQGIDASELSPKLQGCAEEIWKSIPERDWAGRSVDDFSRHSYPSWEEKD